MNAIRRRRTLFVVLLMCASLLIGYLVVIALQQNVNFFFSPSQVVAGQVKNQGRIRVGGMVAKDSLVRGEGLNVQFQITDFIDHLTVVYTGILPDLFKEGQGVVVEGRLQANGSDIKNTGVINADLLMVKHSEVYDTKADHSKMREAKLIDSMNNGG